MLRTIDISNLRNITSSQLVPGEGINLVTGPNGAGKTSILEAVHLLALGKSFRTRNLSAVIQFEKSQFQVVGHTQHNIPVGLQFSVHDGIKIKLNGLPLRRLSDLANEIPLQLIPANCHLFFEQGPRYRRQVLDWGLFHVEPHFNLHWQSYKKVLQQRNAALKSQKSDAEITLWDEQLVFHGEQLAQLREQHLLRIQADVAKRFSSLCPAYSNAEYRLAYKYGWKKERTLAETLHDNLQRDKQLGYTRSGPHAADWMLRINEGNPAEVLSRGQQKLFFLAVCMAQAQLLADREQQSNRSILLFDDLCSELDVAHQHYVIEQIAQLPVQTFITVTDYQPEDLKEITVFHVEQGEIRQQ